MESRYEGDFGTLATAWIKLDQAFQQRTESLFQWSDRLNRIGDSIFRLDVSGRKSLEPKLISKFCFAAWDRDAGVKAMEEAVESVRWYQHVQGAVDNNYAERPRVNVRGWSPEREKLDRRDQYLSRRDDTDSRYDHYRGNFRAAQPHSTYHSRSPKFGRYEDSLSRAEDGWGALKGLTPQCEGAGEELCSGRDGALREACPGFQVPRDPQVGGVT